MADSVKKTQHPNNGNSRKKGGKTWRNSLQTQSWVDGERPTLRTRTLNPQKEQESDWFQEQCRRRLQPSQTQSSVRPRAPSPGPRLAPGRRLQSRFALA